MRLREQRIAHKMKATQVVNIINIPQSTYSLYENGRRRPPIPILRKLARLYGTTIDALVGDEDTAPSLDENPSAPRVTLKTDP
ncbi:MAG: helix-turn-helix domain-containing protein, partial [Oscillospiraceae bacterium]|nr:helix-turn-helix domain-containing protein [Oscillospiraceae bacterium]